MPNLLNPYHEIRQNKNAYRFCLLVFPYTWFFWGTAIFSLQTFDSFSGKLLLFAGMIGPLVITLFLIRNNNIKSKNEFLEQVYDYKRITSTGYLLVLFIPVVIKFLSILLSVLFGYSLKQFSPDPVITFSFLSFFIFLVSTFLVGPLPEEIGWRGFLLESWLQSYSPLKASLLTGLVWAIWQIPLFFVPEFPLQRDAGHPLFVLLYLMTIFSKSIVFTFFYIMYNRSILSAILLHFSINIVALIIRVEILTVFFEWILWTIIAAILIKQMPALPLPNNRDEIES